MTSVSQVVLVSWKRGMQIHAEDLVRPSVAEAIGAAAERIVVFDI